MGQRRKTQQKHEISYLRLTDKDRRRLADGWQRGAKYLRISDDREGRKLGVKRQDEDLDAIADDRRVVWVARYMDNDTSASPKSNKPRPAYNRMLADAVGGQLEVIAGYSTSRVTRRPLENEALIKLYEEHGIQYAYVVSGMADLSTAQGRKTARDLAAQDAYESEIISERVTREAQQRARMGRHKGGPRAYGFAADGVTQIPEEIKVIRRCADALLEGVSLRALTADLIREGIPTVTGARWSTRTVKGIMVRPRNIGKSVYRGEVVGDLRGPDGQRLPPILPVEQHHALVALLQDPSRSSKNRAGPSARYLLSGIAICGVHGCLLEAAAATGGAGGRRYRCKTETGSGHVTRNVAALDDAVTKAVLGRIRRRDLADVLLQSEAPTVDVPALRAEDANLITKLERLTADRYMHEKVDERSYLATKELIEQRRGEIADELAAAMRVSTGRSLVPLLESDRPEETWQALPLGNKRAIISWLLDVVVLPVARRGRGFSMEFVELRWKVSDGLPPTTAVLVD